MKRIRKQSIALFLVVLLCCGIASLAVAESTLQTGELNIITYNIAGLPIPAFVGRNGGRQVWRDTLLISEQLGKADFHLVAVQEDFNAHNSMKKHMDAYPYQTFTSGGIPSGDGLNYFSKLPIYNVDRQTWRTRYGVINHSSDQLTPKGFLFSRMELAPGIYVDIYNLHADAGGKGGSLEARKDNFRQIAEYIEQYSAGNAVIVMGDFNAALYEEESDKLYELLLSPAGLTDVWAAVHNNGDHLYSSEKDWSSGDTIDRVLFRGGNGITFNARSYTHAPLQDSEGKSLSDHWSVQVKLEYAFDSGDAQVDETLKAPTPNYGKRFVNSIQNFFKALGLLLSSFYTMITGGEVV